MSIKLFDTTLRDGTQREGVSLNQYVVMLLTRGEAEARAGRTRPRSATAGADA